MIEVLRKPFSAIVLIYQSIVLALGQVWANKLRSFLTTLGILIGVAAVAGVISALTGMKTFVLSEFETFGTKKMYVFARWPDEGRHAHASWRVIRFTPEQFDGWEQHCPSVSNLTRIRGLGGTIQYRDREAENAEITGIEPSWHEIENRKVVQGRTFSRADQDEARQVCIISSELRDKLRLDRDCTGQSILINNRRFTVIGLIEPRPQTEMFRDTSTEAEVFIPFSTAWKLEEGWMYAMAECREAEVSDDARAELRFFLRQKRGLYPDDPDTFRIEVMQQFLDQFKNMSRVLTMIAVGIVAVSLLVGGVGIMNIMLVSVSERTREIGLRKAVGALPSVILLQFLIEAVILCMLGGLIGLLGGWGIAMIIRTAVPGMSHASIPPWAIILAFGFSGSVGVIFGMFPAIKAALLDPIEALRHD